MIYGYDLKFSKPQKPLSSEGGARGVMVIVVWNAHGNTCSNSGRDWLHFI